MDTTSPASGTKPTDNASQTGTSSQQDNSDQASAPHALTRPELAKAATRAIAKTTTAPGPPAEKRTPSPTPPAAPQPQTLDWNTTTEPVATDHPATSARRIASPFDTSDTQRGTQKTGQKTEQKSGQKTGQQLDKKPVQANTKPAKTAQNSRKLARLERPAAPDHPVEARPHPPVSTPEGQPVEQPPAKTTTTDSPGKKSRPVTKTVPAKTSKAKASAAANKPSSEPSSDGPKLPAPATTMVTPPELDDELAANAAPGTTTPVTAREQTSKKTSAQTSEPAQIAQREKTAKADKTAKTGPDPASAAAQSQVQTSSSTATSPVNPAPQPEKQKAQKLAQYYTKPQAKPDTSDNLIQQYEVDEGDVDDFSSDEENFDSEDYADDSQTSAPAPPTSPQSSQQPATTSPATQSTASITSAPPPPAGITALLLTADVDRGRKLIARCTGCHTLKKNDKRRRIGPNLFDVIGRKVASVSAYRYSSALKKQKGTWTASLLDCYLKKPRTCIPGTSMAFAGIKNPRHRADIVLYLMQNKP